MKLPIDDDYFKRLVLRALARILAIIAFSHHQDVQDLHDDLTQASGE